jgi:oligosaccharide repeat unit polymerase
MFIAFSLLFSLASVLLALKWHDRFDPARYLLLMWGGQILVLYFVFHNLFHFTGYGLAFISFACLVFSAGTLTVHFLGNNLAPSGASQYTFNSKRALLLLQICIAIALINVFLGIRASGFKITEIFSFSMLVKLNVAVAENRYTGIEQSSLTTQLTLIFIYLAPLYGGYLLPLLSGRKKTWCYLSAMPALLISITQAVKLGFITSIILWVTGIIVSSYANNISFFQVGRKMIIKVSLGSILFFFVLFTSMIFRTGKLDMNSAKYIGNAFTSYAFGHLPAFDAWFTNNIGDISPTGGLKTFYGITNFLGIAERKQGVFTDLVYFSKNNFKQIPPGYETNVYSLFRFILEDFGFLGSLLFMYLAGLFTGFSWLMIKKQVFTHFFQSLLIAMLFFVFMSFATSVWVYTSYIVTMILIYFIISYSFTRIKNKPQVCSAH